MGCVAGLKPLLSPDWTLVVQNIDFPDIAILSRHPAWTHTAAFTSRTMGVKGADSQNIAKLLQCSCPSRTRTT